MNHSSKFCASAIPMTSINFFQPKRKKIIFYFPSALNFDYLHGFVKCLHVSISGILLVYIMWPNYSNQFCAPAIDCRFTFFFFNQDLFALAYHLNQCDEIGSKVKLYQWMSVNVANFPFWPIKSTATFICCCILSSLLFIWPISPNKPVVLLSNMLQLTLIWWTLALGKSKTMVLFRT